MSREFAGLGRAPAINIAESASVEFFIAQWKPDYVIHLAAISNPSHPNRDEIKKINVGGTRNLLAAIEKATHLTKKFVFASSGSVYSASSSALTETSHLGPSTFYGESKLESELEVLAFGDLFPVAIARPFNYTGVGQAKTFVIPKIVDHFRSSAKKITLGNTAIHRDFSDVRDVAAYYESLLVSSTNKEIVNFCSGVTTSLDSVLRDLTQLTGREIEVEVSAALVRDEDNPRVEGDPLKLITTLGVKQEFDMNMTLSWMLNS